MSRSFDILDILYSFLSFYLSQSLTLFHVVKCVFENEFYNDQASFVNQGVSAATHAVVHVLQGVLATCEVTISCTFISPILV